MATTHSPLRYPGGKTCLYPLVSEIIRTNRLELCHYAEPYAGGCGLAFSLLFGGHVSEIHINDLDPAVWAFWDCVLNYTDDFVDLINSTEITVPEWRRQREVFRNRNGDKLSVAFAAFFLNRTNRSGIIEGAGVIGGLDQSGNYKIDCRFNKEMLCRRIRRISKYSTRIHLSNLDAIDFMRQADADLPSHSLFCIDPPYFNKGSSLYTSFYSPDDHAGVCQNIMKLEKPWLVTYDDTPEVRKLFKSRRQFSFDINYSIQSKRVGTELMIASKGLRVTRKLRERLVNRPQYRAA